MSLPTLSLVDHDQVTTYMMSTRATGDRDVLMTTHRLSDAPDWNDAEIVEAADGGDKETDDLTNAVRHLVDVIDRADLVDEYTCNLLGWRIGSHITRRRTSELSPAESYLTFLAYQSDSDTSPHKDAGTAAVTRYRADGTLPQAPATWQTHHEATPVTEPDPSGRYIALQYGGMNAHDYFRVDDRGELLETTHVTAGHPDWTEAGIVDVGRFADVAELSAATLAVCVLYPA